MSFISAHLKGLAQFAGREARGRFWPWVGISAALYMVSFIGILALTLAGTDAANNGNPSSEIANLFFMNGVVCAIIVALLAAAVVRRCTIAIAAGPGACCQSPIWRSASS